MKNANMIVTRMQFGLVSLMVLGSGFSISMCLAADKEVDPIECGKACMSKKDYKRAEADFKRAIQKAPHSCEGHFLLGQVYCKVKQYSEGKEQLRLAIRYGKGSVNAQRANDALLQLPKELVAPKIGVAIQNTMATADSATARDAEIKPTVIDFYATWCSPCQQLHATLEKAKTEYGDKINFQRVDVDDNNNQKLVDQYEISPIPTVIFLNPKGEIVSFTVGYSGDAAISDGIKKILPAS
ncbi:MAG TPA: thioredoxin domain-containing protein [Drouetiella sp.]